MVTRHVYPSLINAPIEEAIISITIGRQRHTSLQELEKVCQKLKTAYPQRKNWKIKELAFEESGVEVKMARHEKTTGYVLSSEDQKQMLHLSQDTLSFNRLKPYGSWEDFSTCYKAAWDVFTEFLQIEEVNGITIRYINNFTIPALNWEKYLLMRPNFQQGSDFDDSTISMGEVFSRYILVSEKYMAQSVVLLTLQPKTQDLLRVIMDIETFSRTPITGYSGYHDIIDVLNRLRGFKNQIFFSSLPKAEELFS